MIWAINPQHVRRCLFVAAAAGWFAAASGLLAVAGWAAHLDWLRVWLPGTPPVRPLPAFCFFLLGVALLAQRRRLSRRMDRGLLLALRSVCGVVLLIGAIGLIERLFDWNSGLDQWLNWLNPGAGGDRNRLGIASFVTSLDASLYALSIAFLDLRGRRGDWAAQLPAAFGGVAAAFALMNVLLVGYGATADISMASAANCIVLSVGILCSRPEWALGGLLVSSSEGARWLRRALPAALALQALLLIFLIRPLKAAGRLDWVELSGLAVFAGLLVIGLIAWGAILLNRMEGGNERALAALTLNSDQLHILLDNYEEEPDDTTARRWSKAAIALGVVLIGAGLLFCWRVLRQAAEDEQWVMHTHVVASSLDGVLTHLEEIEASDRGYAVTGDARFLEAIARGRADLKEDLDSLSALIVDNTQQRKRLLENLLPQIGSKMEIVDRVVVERKRTGVLPEGELLLEGKRRTEAVRRTVEQMLAIETNLLSQRQARAAMSRRQVKSVITLCSLLGACMLLLAGAATVREINRSAKARGRIRSINSLLEDRVEQRTRALTESEERLRLFVEHAPAALAMLDREMRYLVASRRWIDDFMLDESALLGHSHYEIFPEIPERWKKLHRRCLAGEVLREDEDRFERADGSVQWLKWEIRPWLDAAGSIGGIVIFSEDITARKQAEEAERQHRARLDAALSSMSDAVYISDAQGKFLQINEGFLHFYHFPDRESCSKSVDEFGSIFEVYEGESQISTQTERWPTMRALRGEVGQDVEYTIRRAAGGEGWYGSYSFAPVRDKQGGIVGAVVVARDITKRKADEREVLRLNAELELRVDQRTAELQAAVKELEAFTYSVSHDLRAPVRHISGFAKMLSEDFGEALPAEGRRFLDRILDGAQRMGSLIDDLLNLGRVGRQDLNMQTTGLGVVVQEVIRDLQSECEDRSVEWRVGQLPFVDCDPGLIRQVLHNLLANALKFTRLRSPAVIEIGQLTRDKKNIVFVRDNGVGFSMKYADKLFGVFQRLHRQEDFEGTGVGLATVQRIIQKHGGRIWAEAELDKGAAFFFTLDSAEENVSGEPQEEASYVRKTI